jgi:hypothetical protein
MQQFPRRRSGHEGADARSPAAIVPRGKWQEGLMGMRSLTKLAVAIVVVSALGFEAHASGTDQALSGTGQAPPETGQAQGFDVDVAVVFAVDFSSSIDPATAALQRNGHAASLTSPEIIRALSTNTRGCIAISYFEWASPQSIRTFRKL